MIEPPFENMSDDELVIWELGHDVSHLRLRVESLEHIVRILCHMINKPLLDMPIGEPLALWEDRPM